MPEKKTLPSTDTPNRLRAVLRGVYKSPDSRLSGVRVLNHRSGCPVQMLPGNCRMLATLRH